MKTLGKMEYLVKLDTKRTVLTKQEKARIIRALKVSIETEDAFHKGRAEFSDVIKKHNELVDVAKEIFDHD